MTTEAKLASNQKTLSQTSTTKSYQCKIYRILIIPTKGSKMAATWICLNINQYIEMNIGQAQEIGKRRAPTEWALTSYKCLARKNMRRL